MLQVSEIRQSFLDYFKSHGHSLVPSSSLLPDNDPTLLFTNAGMNQFKDVFLGIESRPYTRATSVQKCVRAGGKHNDLDNVGFTARHHTFFEMLGNFSFGDYFKKEAIHYAWMYLTETLELPKDRLRVSVHISDDEAAEIWRTQEGVSSDRIMRFDEDNFWSMGDTGPCGPCSEIFWDLDQEVDGESFVEIWNLVFMQFDRKEDGSMVNLAKPCIDTGMGLERISTVLQGKLANYDTDLFSQLIQKTQNLAKDYSGQKPAYQENSYDVTSTALRVVADHLRSTSFLIADGVLPSNEGRGYVLRRILRRAIRFGKQLGFEKAFLTHLVDELVLLMGDAYPELNQRKNIIQTTLSEEEVKFHETLSRGLGHLENAFEKLGSSKQLSADVAFKLYDTFGFPLDLTELISKEKNISVDVEGFQKLMSQQRERARKSWQGSGDTALPQEVRAWATKDVTPHFTGYDSTQEESKILVKEDISESKAWFAIDPCPFYAESGGQVGDQGKLVVEGKTLKVLDTKKAYANGNVLLVEGDISGIQSHAAVKAYVDCDRRNLTKANHTATHLLQASLRTVLGDHVAQAGSYVGPDRLRFDFSHNKAISSEEKQKIEEAVNAVIAKNTPIIINEMSYDEAIDKGAMALFGEKYGDVVRVVDVPGFSTELCGGTHVGATGDIGEFVIVSESAVSSGTRRIEALTSQGALDMFKQKAKQVDNISQLLKISPEQVEDRVSKLLDENKNLKKEVEQLKQKIAAGSSSAVEEKTAEYKGVVVKIVALGDDFDSKMLRQKADSSRQKDKSSAHVLMAGKQVLVTSANPDVHSGDILKALLKELGGKGGGQQQTAQGQLEQASEVTSDDVVKWFAGQS